jgi:hypothetical protein
MNIPNPFANVTLGGIPAGSVGENDPLLDESVAQPESPSMDQVRQETAFMALNPISQLEIKIRNRAKEQQLLREEAEGILRPQMATPASRAPSDLEMLIGGLASGMVDPRFAARTAVAPFQGAAMRADQQDRAAAVQFQNDQRDYQQQMQQLEQKSRMIEQQSDQDIEMVQMQMRARDQDLDRLQQLAIQNGRRKDARMIQLAKMYYGSSSLDARKALGAQMGMDEAAVIAEWESESPNRIPKAQKAFNDEVAKLSQDFEISEEDIATLAGLKASIVAQFGVPESMIVMPSIGKTGRGQELDERTERNREQSQARKEDQALRRQKFELDLKRFGITEQNAKLAAKRLESDIAFRMQNQQFQKEKFDYDQMLDAEKRRAQIEDVTEESQKDRLKTLDKLKAENRASAKKLLEDIDELSMIIAGTVETNENKKALQAARDALSVKQQKLAEVNKYDTQLTKKINEAVGELEASRTQKKDRLQGPIRAIDPMAGGFNVIPQNKAKTAKPKTLPPAGSQKAIVPGFEVIGIKEKKQK